jgi:hypothetical protein
VTLRNLVGGFLMDILDIILDLPDLWRRLRKRKLGKSEEELLVLAEQSGGRIIVLEAKEGEKHISLEGKNPIESMAHDQGTALRALDNLCDRGLVSQETSTAYLLTDKGFEEVRNIKRNMK